MRWSPFAAISTILAVTSIFEGVLSAPLDLLEVRAGVRQSIEKRNPPKVTLGPKGRNVVLDKKFGSPTITRDGVTIAKEIELHDHKGVKQSPVNGKSK